MFNKFEQKLFLEKQKMKTKRMSITNPAFQQMRILKTSQALNMEVKLVERLFSIFERNTGKQLQMSFGLSFDILKRQQNFHAEKSELEDDFNTKSNTVQFTEFCKIYLKLKQIQQQSDNQQTEIINSFVALGGQPDKTGTIKKSVIINIIKNQFELTFDIQQLLQRNGNNDNLDYDAFSQMFQKVQQSQSDLARSSFTSIIKSKDIQQSQELKVKYQDFESWLLLNGV